MYVKRASTEQKVVYAQLNGFIVFLGSLTMENLNFKVSDSFCFFPLHLLQSTAFGN